MVDLPNPDPLAVGEAAARAGGAVLRDWLGRFAVNLKSARDFVTEADYASQREVRRLLAAAFPADGFVGEEADLGVGQPPSGQPGHAGSGRRWIVDPLDGTTNYVHGFPAYCVSVALADGDDLLAGAIYDPVRDECFTAAKGRGAWLDGKPLRTPRITAPGDAIAAVSFPPHVTSESPSVADFLAVMPHVHAIRRTGSTALNLAYLACGRMHVFWARQIACWDAAAGLLIVREAGGAVGPFPTAAADGTRGGIRLDDPAFLAASTPELLAAVGAMLAGPPPARG
jgi:myo-inositol-1(or 4)-monophosphatase